jgi:hypothetical protein
VTVFFLRIEPGFGKLETFLSVSKRSCRYLKVFPEADRNATEYAQHRP